MKNILTWAVVCVCCLSTHLGSAQVMYACIGNSANSNFPIGQFDIGTCTFTPFGNTPYLFDIAVSPSGLLYGIGLSGNLISINPTTGAMTTIVTNIGVTAYGLEYGQDGFLYAIGTQITKINPTNGVVQSMGSLPSGWSTFGDLVYLNGIYYSVVMTPVGERLANMNLANPASSTIITTVPIFGLIAGASVNHPTCPKLYWATTTSGRIREYDINSSTWLVKCALTIDVFSGADTPNDYTFPINCCITDAGNITSQNFNFCGTTPTVTVPFSGGQVLDANDVLRYILFSNATDPTGSIIEQSATPTFSFNPATMTLGQTYYLATIAGNALNGMVDLTDPCLDISNIIEVRWNALPTVSFSVLQSSVCAAGCYDVQVSFTGSAPFSLTYTATSVAGTQTQTFGAHTGALSICPPAGFTGQVAVQAVSLTGANCTCP